MVVYATCSVDVGVDVDVDIGIGSGVVVDVDVGGDVGVGVDLDKVPVRAMENHVHMVYANWAEFRSAAGVPFNGRSRIAGPRGEVVMSFGEGESGLKVATLVEKEGNATSYEDDYLQDLRPNLYTVYMQ